jgi:hypothetical protein
MTHYTQIPRADMCALAEAISTLLQAEKHSTDQIEKVDRLRTAAIAANPHQYAMLCAAFGINSHQSAEQLRATPEKLDRELSIDSFRATLSSVVELARDNSAFMFAAAVDYDNVKQRLIDLYPGTLEEICALLGDEHGITITADTTGEDLIKKVKP